MGGLRLVLVPPSAVLRPMKKGRVMQMPSPGDTIRFTCELIAIDVDPLAGIGVAAVVGKAPQQMVRPEHDGAVLVAVIVGLPLVPLRERGRAVGLAPVPRALAAEVDVPGEQPDRVGRVQKKRVHKVVLGVAADAPELAVRRLVAPACDTQQLSARVDSAGTTGSARQSPA